MSENIERLKGAFVADHQGELPKGFALGWHNFLLLGIGFVIIIAGFILMAGGGSDDPAVFDPSIYDFRHLTLAPIVVLLGFGFEIFAILKK